ncbi:MAG: hypothetical protein AAAC50_09400, partial [Rhizobium altiplani]|uniref:hypothetical protein n=1 Tax=Rhizobium altiplani TaxID=1864509 RepID=UPI0030F0EE7F
RSVPGAISWVARQGTGCVGACRLNLVIRLKWRPPRPAAAFGPARLALAATALPSSTGVSALRVPASA